MAEPGEGARRPAAAGEDRAIAMAVAAPTADTVVMAAVETAAAETVVEDAVVADAVEVAGAERHMRSRS